MWIEKEIDTNWALNLTLASAAMDGWALDAIQDHQGLGILALLFGNVPQGVGEERN